MKKIFSLILAWTFVLSAVSYAAYLPQDVVDTEFQNEVELMINLGLLDYSDEGMFKPYSHMTRAEFAKLLDGILATKITSAENPFADVDENHFARESINRLYEYGYVNGDGNAYFRAEDDITYSEAVRVMVSVLGYDQMAVYSGGYPTGYTTVASNIGITKNVSRDGEYINRGNILRLLVNCFDANLVEVVFKNGKPATVVNKEITMLSEMAGIYYVKDYVNANSDYSISGSLANKGYLTIGSTQMLSPADYEDYVGYFVTCYYRENANDELEIVFLKINENKNNLLKAWAKDISAADDYSCSVLMGDRSKTIKFSAETVFTYNGKLAKSFSADMLQFENGWVEFIDNNADGRYELVKISEYYNMVVEALTEDSIYNKYDSNGTIDLKDADIRIFDENGTKIAVSGVGAGDVLSVFKSGEDKDRDLIKLVRSKKTVTGTVENKQIEVDGIYVVISGKEYRLYSGYQTNTSKEIFLKDSGEFLLDAYQNIVSMRGLTAGVYKPAYMIDVREYISDDTGENVLRFKFLGESGVFYIMANEKIKIDGISSAYSDFQNVARALQSLVNQVVLYKLNSKGLVTVLDTIDQNNEADRDDRLTLGPVVDASTGLRYKGTTSVFEGKFAIDDHTKVFLVPADPKNAADTEFSFRDKSYFVSDQSYKGMVTYRVDSKKIPVDYVVLQASTSIINNRSDIAVVKRISHGVNENDEEVIMLDVYANGTERSYVTSSLKVAEQMKHLTKYARAGDTLVDFDPTSPVLGVGDIIKYSFDAGGALDCIAIIYSAAANKMQSVNPYHTDFHEQGQRYVMGTVSKKYEGYIELDVNGSIECHNIGVGQVFAVERDKKEMLRKISFAEIRDAQTYTVGDMLIIITEAGTQKMTLLYK